MEEHLRAVECGVGDGNLTLAAVEWGMQKLLEPLEATTSLENEAGSSTSTSRKRLRIADQDECSLEEFLQLVDSGELGSHYAARVDALLKFPEYASLLSLIDHCILLSLDQTSPDSVAGAAEDGQLWLVGLVVRRVVYGEQTQLQFSRLDWLLAYLTAARPEIFIRVLFDELTKDLLRDDSQVVSLAPYFRQAGILELSTLRAPEQISVSLLPLIPPLRFSSERVSDSHLMCYSYSWAIQCCFCPRFFSCLAKAWAPTFRMESLASIWKLLETANLKQASLPTAWKTALVAGLSDARAWLYTIVTKHLKTVPELAADILILATCCSTSLVDWLNREFSAAAVIHITGNQKDDWSRALANSLQHNINRILDAYLSSQRESQSHLLRTCQIILLSCEDQAVADVFVRATISDGVSSTTKLQIVAACMRSFCVLERDKSILRLWAQGVADLLHISETDQILSRLSAIRQLVDPLFWDKCLGNEFCWKRTLKTLCTALDVHWLRFLALLHKTGEYAVLLSTLELLQSLTLEAGLSTRELEPKLKGAVGLYFYWVKDTPVPTNKWHHMRAISLLKRMIVHLAAASVGSFTMLVTFLLDSSIEVQMLPSSATNTSVLSAGSSKVDRYGKVSFPSSKRLFVEEISGCCLNKTTKSNSSGNTKNATFCEYSSLLTQCMKMAIKSMQSRPEDWPSHPAEVLGRLLTHRLETPHELSITMEQYEEVLPKHVSFVRHTFLIGCVAQNTFLFKVLQLVMEHGQAGQLQICAELVRALMAESITKWQGQHTTVQDSEADRMQLFDIIQLTVSAGWLPHPVASCGEIISLISAEDIASLLLILWRCMHDAMASGFVKTSAAEEAAATATATAASENQAAAAVKEGSNFKDWEVQFLSILRRNVSRIGAHIARLYPQRC